MPGSGSIPPSSREASLPADAPPAGATVTRFRVRYAETDRMGVVYYANYLAWFEMGRSDLMRERGFPYTRLEEEGVYLPVAETGCRFLAPARYDEEVEVITWPVEVKSRKVLFGYHVRRAETLLATGFTWHVSTDRDGKVVLLPPAMRQSLERR